MEDGEEGKQVGGMERVVERILGGYGQRIFLGKESTRTGRPLTA